MQNPTPQARSLSSLNISLRPRLSRIEQPAPAWRFGTGLDVEHRLWLTSARAGITLALQHAGLGPGDEVLVPAYACRSMIDPVRHLRLTPVHYALDEDLRLTIGEFERRRTPLTRAVLLTRFHGFACEAVGLYDYCRRNGIVVIEDRAHAFFGGGGHDADYVVYSMPKFFPVFEGGLLVSRYRALDRIPVERSPSAFQLKAALWPYEYASDYDDAPSPRVIAALLRTKRVIKDRLMSRFAPAGAVSMASPAAADGGADFEPYWINKAMSVATRRAILASNLDWIAARRRHNWRRLARNLTCGNALKLVHLELPDDVVPYVLAFTVDEPDAVAQRMRSAGVPLYRWDSFAVESADESLRSTVQLSRRILQVPTHQAMTDGEIDGMSMAILRCIREGKTEAG